MQDPNVTSLKIVRSTHKDHLHPSTNALLFRWYNAILPLQLYIRRVQIYRKSPADSQISNGVRYSAQGNYQAALHICSSSETLWSCQSAISHLFVDATSGTSTYMHLNYKHYPRVCCDPYTAKRNTVYTIWQLSFR